MAKGFQDQRYRGLIASLANRRGELGMSQAALAKKLGTHQQFVSRYETGERRLDVVEFVDIAFRLDLDPVALVAGLVETA